MKNNGHTPTHSPAVDRYMAATRPRPWADLSSAQRSAQMDAALSMLSDVAEAHNRLNALVVEHIAAMRARESSLWARLLWLVRGR